MIGVRRTGGTLVGCAFAALLLTSCASPGVCTTVAYSRTLTIELSGGSDRVSDVIVCGVDACDSAPDSTDEFDSTQAVSAVRSESDVPIWGAVLFYLSEPLTVFVLDDENEVLLQTAVTPDWARVGGSEECGGPSVAEIQLSVPA